MKEEAHLPLQSLSLFSLSSCPLSPFKPPSHRNLFSLSLKEDSTQNPFNSSSVKSKSSIFASVRGISRPRSKISAAVWSEICKENFGTMIGPNFMDEIDCGSFFDHIEDLLDFPGEDVDVEAGLGSTDCNSFPSVWPTQPESLPSSESVFSANSASDLSAELSVPYEDIVQLEWLSNFVEDSFAGGSLAMKKEDSSIKKESSHHPFQTSSPVSVLDSSSSCSVEKNVPRSPEAITPGRCGRARSKRPRPATFNPRPAIQLISPSSSVTETPQPFLAPNRVSSDSESFAESSLSIKIPKLVTAEHKKKKKMKLTGPQGPVETNQNSPLQAVRKCMHCEITKTPQWRAGPMGPKTLCNACGVRYKSGRLYPEYRPAASPTFIPSVHSNSHKKVLEMRNKFGEKAAITATRPNVTALPELIQNKNSNLGLDYM